MFLLGLLREDFAYVRWLDTRQLAFPGQPDRTWDTVAHIEELNRNSLPWAIVIEFMIEPEPMFSRMVSYLGQLWMEEKPSNERGDRFAVGAVIVNLRGKGDSSRRHVWPKAGMETNLLVREINLSTIAAAETLEQIAQGTLSNVILPWIPLMHGGDESSIIERWKELASAAPISQRRSDLAGLAVVFADAADCWQPWKTALKEWNMTESRQVKEWQDQARREGRHESRVEDLLDFLEAKFGQVPPNVPAHLHKIDDANVLRQLLRQAYRAADLDEIRRMIPNGAK